MEKHEDLEKSQAAYYMLHILLKIQRDARKAAVEERKVPPARGLPLTLDRLVQSR
jgi:hypothetical protein